MSSLFLWQHLLEYWRPYVLPDLMRFYPALGNSEAAILSLPWRELREVLFSLFGIRDSLTGATFARLTEKEDSS